MKGGDFMTGKRMIESEYILAKVILDTDTVRIRDLHILTGRSETILRLIRRSRDFEHYRELVRDQHKPDIRKLARQIEELRKQVNKKKRFSLW